MIKFFLFIIVLISFTAYKSPAQSNNIENQNCFSTENFQKLKEYISNRISISGMGKYYVEFPPDSTQINDGKMRPSNHPENVFDIHYVETAENIIFENEIITITFNSKEGYINKTNHSEKDKILANEIFCYILNQISK